MGGCRCTYRNCTVKYDVKTHMFRYPVFEKIRCLRWLQNAHRMEFINLKVSQLKNRVVCQHHFRANNFMNYKMDKLTFDAIPTEDGPYCDPTKPDYNPVKNDAMGYPITVDDIEHDMEYCYMNIDIKKANMSVKYIDFLTNNGLTDTNTLNSNIVLFQSEDTYNKDATSKQTKMDKMNTTNNITPNNKLEPIITYDNENNQPIVKFENYSNCNLIINSDNISHNEINLKEHQKCLVPTINTHIEKEENLNMQINHPVNYGRNTIKNTKVKILSEKKIHEPLLVTGEFEPVSPSIVIQTTNKKSIKNNNAKCKKDFNIEYPEVPLESNQVIYHNPLENSICFIQNVDENKIGQKPLLNDMYEKKLYTTDDLDKMTIGIDNEYLNKNKMNVEYADCKSDKISFNKRKSLKLSDNKPFVKKPQIKVTRIIPGHDNHNSNAVKSCKELLPYTSLLKNKIPPERVAAIEEKRKFNMKLRDIIEAQLNLLEENEKQADINNQHMIIQKTLSAQEPSPKQQIVTQLMPESTASKLSNNQENIFATLEARIEEMQNSLLNTLQQNSNNIIKELKNTITRSNSTFSVSTQTIMNEELQKKNLYKEISQYLSPETNSLVYEELFLNKYAQKTLTPSTIPKRRRCYR